MAVGKAPGGITAFAGKDVARVGFGAMQLAPDDSAVATKVLTSALEQGVNHVDTAQFYGKGECNALIRGALAPYPEDLVLATKVGAVYDGSEGVGLAPAQRPEQLRASVEANLSSLGVERVDLVNMRRIDDGPLRVEGDQAVDLDDQLAVLAAMRDEGKIGAIGLSHVSVGQLRAALSIGIACVQNAHSVLDRTAEPVLDVCRENDIAWVPYFPLGSAFPGLPKVTEHPTVIAVAERLGVTPAQVGLAWELAHYSRTLLIPGTSNPDHLAENIAAGSVELDDETIGELDASSQS